MSSSVLDSAVRRTPLSGHDGRSGSTLERVLLADGTSLVVKRSTPSTDLAMQLGHDSDGRELVLWSAGVLDRLPPGVEHAVVDGWRDGEDVVLVMRDVSAGLVGWNRELARAECAWLLRRVAAMHDAYAGEPVGGLAALEQRVNLFAPHRMGAVETGDNPLPAAVLRGWVCFAKLAPAAAEPVFALLADPSPLLARLADFEHTMIHGDLWLVNLALTADRLTLLDWGLATWAPRVVEIASFLIGNASQIRASREEIVADYLTVGGFESELAVLHVLGLLELGWNKALDAATHPDPAKRATELADLRWWLDGASEMLGAL
jgi:hypothetical protein